MYGLLFPLALLHPLRDGPCWCLSMVRIYSTQTDTHSHSLPLPLSLSLAFSLSFSLCLSLSLTHTHTLTHVLCRWCVHTRYSQHRGILRCIHGCGDGNDCGDWRVQTGRVRISDNTNDG